MLRFFCLSWRICLVLLMFPGYGLYAQSAQEATEYNKVSIASPTAGALAKFVDVPVSLHTGIPEVNIPLCNVQDGALTLPVSMSYHASGLKVMEPAGWVGAGWALNAGGAITRSVRGTPDEKGTINQFQQFGFFSDYGYRTHLLTTDHYGGRPDSNYFAMYERFAMGERDSEPDLFFFNFGGYSGKFYFNDDRTPMLLPEQDIKIEYQYTYGSSESIQGFILTTPDGVKYYFGATSSTTDVDPVEYTKVFTPENGFGWDKVISSWYLNKIVSADGNSSIDLTYHASYYSYYALSISPVARGNKGYKLIRNYVHGVDLESIKSSNEQVNFILAAQARQDLSNTDPNGIEGVNTTARALDRIDILQKDGQHLLKSYQFAYSYFEDNTGAAANDLSWIITDNKRLKLLSIQEKSSTGVPNPPYSFLYFTEPVPRRMSFGQDHWGFINGVTNNGENLIGTYYYTNNTSTPTTVSGADRDPKWPAMRGGTLQKITFPTGGYNLYDFEPNQTSTFTVDGTNGERTFRASVDAGYDGGQKTKTNAEYFTVDFHQFVFRLSNADQGGEGYLNIYDSNNVLMDHLQATNNQVVEITRNYAPGSYKFEVVKDMAYGGNGARVEIYELAGTIVSTNAMVGGLRIKTITQNSGDSSPDMVTSYSYNDGPNNLSTGVLFGKPSVAQVVRNDIYKNYYRDQGGINENGCPVSYGSGLTFLVSAGSVRAMNSTQGAHIGYRKVTTKRTGNGYSISLFNTDGENEVQHDDIVNRGVLTTAGTCTMDIPNYPSIPEPNSFKRGMLEYQANYDNNGILLSDATFKTDYQDNPMVTPAFVITTNPTNVNNNLIFTWYDQKTGRKIKETTTNKSYYGTGNIETKIEAYYDSPYHHQLTRKWTTNSLGDVLETRYRYVPDYTLTSVDGLSSGLDDNNAALADVNYLFEANMASCSGMVTCQRTAWLDYDIALSHKRLDFIDYRIANFTGPGNTYLTHLQQAVNTVSTALQPMIDMRLQHNYVLIETINLRNSKVINATFNTYDYQPASQNKIYLSKVDKTDFLVPPASFTTTKTGTDNAALVKDAAYNEKAAFEYRSGNITGIKLTDHSPMAYQWGYNGQHPVAEAKNALSTEIFYESFEEGAGNSTRNDARTGDYSHTGTYSKTLSGLTAGKYILSYWKKTGSVWSLVSSKVTVTGNIYPISITGLQIDDLRFYPEDAQITTYTYEPLVGMTSSTDGRNNTTFYEYDDLQRLINIKDQDGNIVKHTDYHYAN